MKSRSKRSIPRAVRRRIQVPPLIAAAEAGILASVERALKEGADIDSIADHRLPDYLGLTALAVAAKQGHLEIVDYLLKQGASIEVPSADCSALARAITYGKLSVVGLLLRHGARNFGFSLFSALENGHSGVFELVSRAGVDLAKVRSRSKESLLERAVQRRKDDVVALLLQLGVSPKFDGALAECAARGDFCLTRLLLEHGADPNRPGGALERLPLMEASYSGSKETVELLLDAGARMDVLDVRGWNCVDWAKWGKKSAQVRWLQQRAKRAGIQIPKSKKGRR